MKLIWTLALLFFIMNLFAQNLEIDGKLKINDGTEGPGKVLMSDMDGEASWTDPNVTLVGIIKHLPGGIQALLSSGFSPIYLYEAGVPADSIYGKYHQGGLVFYLDTLELHSFEGLVAAPEDQSPDLPYGCYNVNTGATGFAIGTGQSNTQSLITLPCGMNQTAADTCANLELNGFDDWFLPSHDELIAIYNNLKVNNIGGLSSALYWSSTEDFKLNSWAVDLATGIPGKNNRTLLRNVRAIRAF